VRTGDVVAPLIAVDEFLLDATGAGVLRRRAEHELPVPERFGALQRERDRIALAAGVERVAVSLIAEDHAPRLAAEVPWRARTDDVEDAAAEPFQQQRVARLGAELLTDRWAIPQHRLDAFLRESLRVIVGGWMTMIGHGSWSTW
jgi:hypothetical protein